MQTHTVIQNNLPTIEKINLVDFVVDIVHAISQQSNLNTTLEDIASYASLSALVHLNLEITAPQIVKTVKHPTPKFPKAKKKTGAGLENG